MPSTSSADKLDSGKESGEGGQGDWSPSTLDSNEHSMKLFNNLIKNTLLALMFCGLHYQPDYSTHDVILKAYSCCTLNHAYNSWPAALGCLIQARLYNGKKTRRFI